MKRYRLMTAVGSVALLTAALGGASAFGGPSGPAQRPAIKIGVLTPLSPGASNFVPWGVQVRAGAALAVNEINRSGGVKGRGQGRKLNLAVADDQSTSTAAAIDGFRAATGPSFVYVSETDRASYLDPFDIEDQQAHAPSAAVAPASVDELRAVLAVASRHRVPLWPVSMGKNFAYGTAAPRLRGAVDRSPRGLGAERTWESRRGGRGSLRRSPARERSRGGPQT